MKITRDILSVYHHIRVGYGLGNRKKYVTIHQTGNTGKGANARAHHNLQKRKGVSHGWHWQVDDKEAIQSYKHEYQIWHAGDGRGPGNTASIGIEICINRDGNYKQAVENGAKLAAFVLKEEGLPVNCLRQHNSWSGKNCPAQIRQGKEGITWIKFLTMVEDFYNGKSPKPKPTTQKTVNQIAQEVIKGKYGNGKERVDKIQDLGYNYREVQKRVNEILSGPQKVYHTIRKGETLWSISQKYGVSIQKIQNLNGIKNPDKIITGDTIRIR